ncbi:MAG: ribonucleoside triphosphate reductase [Nanoarchaeota archaeon]|nr:ribonucleoside triphosphate reductase [Nanoarchaeota archaeon]
MTNNNIEAIDEYLDRTDWRVNANANQGYSLGGLILNTTGKNIANYWMTKIYEPSIGQAHKNGDIHIHDLDMFAGYCCGHSLRNLLNEGYNGIPGKISSKAPKHLSSALGQMVNFIGTLQNEWAGAQAFSSFDTLLAPFVRVEKLTYKQIKQLIEQFIFDLNVPSRWGTQTPFSNLTFDLVCPNDLKDIKPLVGGKEVDFTYGDLQVEADMLTKAFLEVMLAGDGNSRVFSYPIPTFNITKEFNWDSEISNILFEYAGKYGTPYFQNFINSDMDPSDVRSMCCRLSLDLNELKKRGGGLFGASEQTGSVGVVTLNMARIGGLYKEEKSFFSRINHLMEIATSSLEKKRETLEHYLKHDLYPYTKRYVGTFRNHFSTIGVNGMNEMCLAYLGKDITSKEGQAFSLKVLDFMRDKLIDIQERTGHMYNLEASPAEGACYRFAKLDQSMYPNETIQSGTADAPYYTNSSQLPVGKVSDPFKIIELQEGLQTKYTGGTVLHFFFGEKIDGASAKKFVKLICNKTRLPYITISPVFTICKTHGYIKGKHATCPTCGEVTEIWEKVMGYYRPIDWANKGKQSEINERITVTVGDK